MPTAWCSTFPGKHAIRSEITSQLDFRFLNEAWPEFGITPRWLSSNNRSPAAGDLATPQSSFADHGTPPLRTTGPLGRLPRTSMDAFLIRTHFAAAHRLARPSSARKRMKRSTASAPAPRPRTQLPRGCDRPRQDRSAYRHGLRPFGSSETGGRFSGGALRPHLPQQGRAFL